DRESLRGAVADVADDDLSDGERVELLRREDDTCKCGFWCEGDEGLSEHLGPAGPAEQGTSEVVVVGVASFGGDLAGVEQGLDLLPRVDVDEWFVGAGLFGAFVADDADVVRAAA
ncbi:hypothetical protein, partial [Rathayibacter iranicus]